ncbi:hypothetical protein [Actinocorallia longicatena]|uniref:Uncharacterized protein n=1 Tax=Actinocorallia longicatena TaxID=111803 RepID=A0ABP6QLP5_9ACTN
MSVPVKGRVVWLALSAAVIVAAAVTGVFLIRGGTDPSGPKNDKKVQVAALQEDTSAPTAEPIPPDTVPSEKPTVVPQATGLKEETIAPRADREKQGTTSLPANFDGCDHNYGEPTQCVPWTFPDGIELYEDKCLWLKINGFRKTKVHGADRQKLDPDGNKIACDG